MYAPGFATGYEAVVLPGVTEASRGEVSVVSLCLENKQGQYRVLEMVTYVLE